MILPLPRAKRKERFDCGRDPDFDPDFDSDSDFCFRSRKHFPACVLIFIGVEIEIAIGIVTLVFSALAPPCGSRCLSAAGGRRIPRETYGAGFSFCKRLVAGNIAKSRHG